MINELKVQEVLETNLVRTNAEKVIIAEVNEVEKLVRFLSTDIRFPLNTKTRKT